MTIWLALLIATSSPRAPQIQRTRQYPSAAACQLVARQLDQRTAATDAKWICIQGGEA
jgi:hypothetical protein